MAENAIDPMRVYELEATLAQAKEMYFKKSLESDENKEKLEQKNREVEELQKEKEEQARQIGSLIEENERLVGERELATEVEELEGDEGKSAIDPMKVNELETLLAQAQAVLEQKNREVEELQKEKEEQARQIESLIEKNEKLVGVSRERLGEKETEGVLAQNEVKKLGREIAECRVRQERASRNVKTDVEEIRKNVAQIIEQLCHLEVEADSLVEMEGGGELGRTAESSTQTEIEEVEELEGGERKSAIDPMKVNELETLLAQAQAMLEQKNREVEELQKKKEEQARQIESPVAENERLVGERELATEVEKLEGDEENTSVLILGGMLELNTISLLDSKAQSWKKLRVTLPKEMRDFGAAVLNEEIYIFGGDANGYQQDCYKLKDDGSWMQLASLNQKRGYISSSSLVYKGDIWVIGGSSEEILKSVEKYDISQNKWTYMPEMNYARSDAAAAVFKDRIFVTGGYNEKNLKSVEMFDPKLQKWSLFCDLPFEVSGHTMLISNSTLSIFGGYSESGPLNSVWEMDIEDPEKKWTEKQSFNRPRYSFGIGKLSNGIIIFGDAGNNGETSEIFDGKKWIDGPKLPQRLTYIAYTSIPRSLEERFLNKFS